MPAQNYLSPTLYKKKKRGPLWATQYPHRPYPESFNAGRAGNEISYSPVT